MKLILTSQYELVKDSRSALFAYLSTLTPEHFVEEVPNFGRGGSIRSLLTHVANSSQHWIAVHCLNENPSRITAESVNNIEECRQLFQYIDDLFRRLIDTFGDAYHQEIVSTIGDSTFSASPFKVFTHAITHEYHHKGQMLTISRYLGYTPVDTDVIR